MRTTFAALLVMIAACTGASAAEPNQPQTVTLFGALADACQGSDKPGSAETRLACSLRDTYMTRMAAIGWCYGTPEQTADQYTWHRCRPGRPGQR